MKQVDPRFDDEGQLWGASRPDDGGDIWPMFAEDKARGMVELYNVVMPGQGAKVWKRESVGSPWVEVP